MLPVHPEGSLFDGPVVKQQYWIQQSLLRGRDSLIRRICRRLVMKREGLRFARGVQESEVLKEMVGRTWESYLTVLNLRSHGFLQDAQKRQFVVTEQCYVHSKLMIVDDAVAIIGSANVNDRSLMGNGDTELAAVAVDGDAEQRNLGNNVNVVTRGFARELRKTLWRKFLGMGIENWNHNLKPSGYSLSKEGLPHPPYNVRDKVPAVFDLDLDRPAALETWKAIQDIAKANSDIYEAVFQHVPRDAMPRYRDALRGFPRTGYVRKQDGTVHLNADGARTEKVRMHAEPPALQADYMQQPVRFNAETGETEALGEHDLEKASDRLQKLVGFWVRMPLLWGHGQSDPAAAVPGAMIATNEVPATQRPSEAALASREPRRGVDRGLEV